MASDMVTVLVSAITGTSTAAAAYIGARLQAKTELKRLEIENKRLIVEGQHITEGRSEQFGAFRRGVYRGFFDLLDYYPEEEASDEERKKWRKDYDRRLNILLLTAGSDVLEKVRALETDKPETFAGRENIRDELLEAMRNEIFRAERLGGEEST